MMIQKRRITKSYLLFAERKYSRLIKKIAFKFGSDCSQYQELESICVEELLKCMACFDVNGGGSFMTFYFGRASNISRRARKREKQSQRMILMDNAELISSVNKNMVESPDCQEQILHDYTRCLNHKERAIIIELFANGKSARNLADERQMCIASIYVIRRRALGKIRHMLEGAVK